MDHVIRISGAFSALCLAGMVVVLLATLVLRPFGVLVPSSEEIVTFLMVGMAFFGFVYAYAAGAHVRVDTLYRRLRPAIGRTVEIASHFGAALLCAVVAYNGAKLAWTAFQFNDLSDGLIPIPMWIPMSSVPLGFTLLALAILRDGMQIIAGRNIRFAVSEKEEALSLAEGKET
jgi:TRAP-type C4-dicarboxylate transport system permease small subunit